jgi:MFS family permease
MVACSRFLLVSGAIPFLLPLLFQTVFGWSSIKSGALVLFVFAGNVAIKPLTTPLYGTYGFRRVLIAASACLTLTVIACALLTAGTPLVVIALLALVSGAACSVTMTGYTTLALERRRRRRCESRTRWPSPGSNCSRALRLCWPAWRSAPATHSEATRRKKTRRALPTSSRSWS